LIEVQVYHFSGTQTVVFAAFNGTTKEDDRPPGGSGAVVVASCFVDSLSSDSRSIFWFFSLVVGMIILICGSEGWKAGKPESYKAGKLGGLKAQKAGKLESWDA
jgi:hypothetical protein